MKVQIKIGVDVAYLQAECGVRYWEDATVDGVEDEDGTLIPCRDGDYWCPRIDLATGRIVNWEKGKEADIHYKICDDGKYQLLDELGNVVKEIEGYVPEIMYPNEEGYGDYVIMSVNADGFIDNWVTPLNEFSD